MHTLSLSVHFVPFARKLFVQIFNFIVHARSSLAGRIQGRTSQCAMHRPEIIIFLLAAAVAVVRIRAEHIPTTGRRGGSSMTRTLHGGFAVELWVYGRAMVSKEGD